MNINFPKGSIKQINGRCLIVPGDDIDTDRIIPARFLKCVNFNNLGEQVFADDRIELNGNHPFDLDINNGASILIVNDNFGCGSSREHAPQALMRWGIRAIIGESFAEIFFGNCLALGIPCATLSKEKITLLEKSIKTDAKQMWDFDLENLSISNIHESISLEMEKGALEMLTTGKWDATSLLISKKKEINIAAKRLPYLNHFR